MDYKKNLSFDINDRGRDLFLLGQLKSFNFFNYIITLREFIFNQEKVNILIFKCDL